MSSWRALRKWNEIAHNISAWDAIYGLVSAGMARLSWDWLSYMAQAHQLFAIASYIVPSLLLMIAVWFFVRAFLKQDPARARSIPSIADTSAQKIRSSDARDAWAGVKLDVERFYYDDSRSENDPFILDVLIRAARTAKIIKIIVLHQTYGVSNSYTIFQPPTHSTMVRGEECRYTVLHFRQGIGSFWGEPSEETRHRFSDGLDDKARKSHESRRLSRNFWLSCRVILCAEGEDDVTHDFTAYPGGSDAPLIVDPTLHVPFRVD